MAKIFRQKSLNFEAVSSKVQELDCSEDRENEDLSLGMDIGMESDIEEAQSDNEDSQEVTDSEYFSPRCTDITKPHQPTNKVVLSSMAKNGRNFIGKWYKTYPWLTLCTMRNKAFCFFCKKAQTLIFSTKAESTFTNTGFDNWKKSISKV